MAPHIFQLPVPLMASLPFPLVASIPNTPLSVSGCWLPASGFQRHSKFLQPVEAVAPLDRQHDSALP